ncbi:MAG: HU family DNA-binding protein [Syntrophales bacterium]
MNKSDLIEAVSKKGNITVKDAVNVVNMIFDGFTETIKNGGRIEIRGFGSFSAREYEAYTGRNPKTGMGVAVKPKRLPFFKVGKELKSKVDLGKGKTF